MPDDRRYLIPFRATLLPQIFTDTLVIGGGVAGLRAAIAAQQHGDVIVAAKGGIKDSNTYLAQGGVSVVVDEQDSVEEHVQDTLVAGVGLCDEPIVRQVALAARARIDELVGWGMRLDRVEGRLALGREGGHSHPRIIHADGDATGRELAITLDRHVRSLDHVRLFDHCFVLDLITLDGSPPQCLGAITHHPKYGLQVIWARATILTTGGCGQVYRESTNPNASTGDGLAMAFRAGAELADLEFMQFHPTTLYIAGASRSLISEAVRGEGATLIDRHGHRFMPDYDQRGELAPRDIVSRSILKQMAATNHTNVYLDVRHLGIERFAKRFPGIYELLKQFDIDPATQAIPIHPSAHYMVGGVRTDDHGRTNIQGLYAAGEAACTGLHGANRLASNSLLEGLVFGEIVGRICAEQTSSDNAHSPVKVISDIRPSDRSELDLADVRSSLRSVMWRHVGIERQGERLNEVAEMFDFWARYTLDKIFDDRTGWEVQNLLTVGSLITRAASWRKESRGCHYRLDCPEAQDTLRVHDIWKRGEVEPTSVAVTGDGRGSAVLTPKG
jgi:L-aspartate oxidase